MKRGTIQNRPSAQLLLLGLVLSMGLVGCQTYQPRLLDKESEWKALVELGRDLSLEGRVQEELATSNREWFPLALEVDLDDGLTLSEANSIAIFYNSELLQSRHHARIAGAQLIQAGLLKNPELFLGPRFSSDPSSVIFPASLSMSLPLWGGRNARKDVAASDLELKRLAIEVKELEVLVAVRRLFLGLNRVSQEIETMEALDRIAALIGSWVVRFREAGEIDVTTSWLASWEQSQIEIQKRQKHADQLRLKTELNQVLGLRPGFEVEVILEGSDHLPELPPSGFDYLSRHPALRTVEELYARSEARLRHEVSQQYPEVTLGPDFEDDGADSSLGFGLGIELPIFELNQGNIGAAEASRSALADQYRAKLLELSHQESKARAAAKTSIGLLRILREGPASKREETLLALETRLELGVSSLLELLTLQRALGDARLQEIDLESRIRNEFLTASVAGGSALRRPSDVASQRGGE